MAQSYKTLVAYTLDSVNREFDIPYQYLARRFIVVSLLSDSGEEPRVLVMGTDYRFVSKTRIQLTRAWGSNDGYARIELRRVTSATDRLIDFSDGSILRAYDLNTAQLQALHVAEEGREQTLDASKFWAEESRKSAENAAGSSAHADDVAAYIDQALANAGDRTMALALISSDETKGDALVRFRQPFAGAVDSTVHDKLKIYISVTDFGAKGDGDTDDAPAINAALAGGNRNVHFPNGNYLIKSYCRIYANTTLQFSSGAVILNDNQTAECAFMNGELGNREYASGYDGEGNITIEGGTVDNSPRTLRGQLSQGIAFSHARGIRIVGTKFRNNLSSHFVRLDSIQDAVIDGCSFRDLNPNTAATDGSRECISITHSAEAGFPSVGSYDNTVCDNIKVVNCEFVNGDVGVGTHSISPLGLHTRINVSNNRFLNMQSVGVAAWCWSQSIVMGNRLVNCGARSVKIWACEDVQFIGNTIVGQGAVAQLTVDSNNGVTSHGIIIMGNTFVGGTSHQVRVVIAYNVSLTGNTFRDSTNSGIITSVTASQLNIVNNTFHNCGQSTPAASIRLGSPDSTISGNKIGGSSILYGYGVWVEDGALRTTLKGNDISKGVTASVRYATAAASIEDSRTVALAANTVAVFDIETPRKQGVLFIASSAKEVAPNGSLYIRANAGEEDITDIAVLGTFDKSTSVLTGTTGVAGKVTLSVNAGKLYVENRIAGGTSMFRIQLLTV